MAPDADVLVLGAGLTGVTAALELARAGVAVTLVDQDERPMNRASLRNEGKIHLGFVFAHDHTLATARLMIEGALRFRSLLCGLAGDAVDALVPSHPFTYLVPEDSLLTPEEIGQRYAAMEKFFAEQMREYPGLDYLGTHPDSVFRPVPLGSLGGHIRTEGLVGAFRTAELAIDTQTLAAVLQAAVAAEPGIRFLPRHKVMAVERRGGHFQAEGSCSDGLWRLRAEQVVNASWESRFRIDATVGIEHPPGWLHRLKYRVIARLPERMRAGPSITMVVGPYGDVVVRPDGTAYFSWYPLGLRGWTHDLAPPDAWDAPCRGEVLQVERREVAAALLGAIDAWYPGAAQAVPLLVDAGAIVAYGRTDVNDPASGLHDRTRVGVLSVDGYHSVDPGKLTTAPLFGVRAARAVLAERVAA